MNTKTGAPEYEYLFCGSSWEHVNADPRNWQIITVAPSAIDGYWHLGRITDGEAVSTARPMLPWGAALMLRDIWRAPSELSAWKRDVAIATRKSDAERKPKQDVVYFLRAGPFVKIGFTAGDPQRRIDELQTGCPYPIRLLGTIPGSQQLERQLHLQFAHLRASGEWFRAHSDITNLPEGAKSSECKFALTEGRSI